MNIKDLEEVDKLNIQHRSFFHLAKDSFGENLLPLKEVVDNMEGMVDGYETKLDYDDLQEIITTVERMHEKMFQQIDVVRGNIFKEWRDDIKKENE
jgi:hypothetical protein